jgi:hypothetical protein
VTQRGTLSAVIRRTAVAAVLAAGVLLPQPSAQAAGFASLSISVPTSASLGSQTTGASSISGSLGSVTVTTGAGTGLAGSGQWTATVVSTAFKTGAGSANETIAAGSVSYRSGQVTGTTGLAANLCTPGQPVSSVSIGTTQTAMSCGGVPLLTGTTVTWQPTITIALPVSAVAGTYTGTITHSVA